MQITENMHAPIAVEAIGPGGPWSAHFFVLVGQKCVWLTSEPPETTFHASAIYVMHH